MRITLDPGHGGDKLGAVGPSGTTEKHINLNAARVLKDLFLKAGHKVEMTRDMDAHVPLWRRCEIANLWEANLFLSLHCNASTDPSYEGIECYTSKGYTNADKWAARFQTALLKAFPEHKDFAGTGTSEENFYVLKNTAMPAVLIEMEFISNPKQELFLKQFYPDIVRVIADEIGKAGA